MINVSVHIPYPIISSNDVSTICLIISAILLVFGFLFLKQCSWSGWREAAENLGKLGLYFVLPSAFLWLIALEFLM